MTRFLAPFRRLHQRAEVFAAGDLPPPPSRVHGTRELKVVTESFDAMSGSLALIERQTAALAGGELDSEALRARTMTEAGRSIDASIVRLATVTGLLAASESRSSAILEHAAIGIWTIGIDGRIRSANAAAARLVGLDARTQRGRMLTEFLPAFDGEQLIRPSNGHSIPVLTQAVTVPAEPEPLLTVFARDISERKQFEERLAHQARHDALTGLPNRFAVLEHLENVLMNGVDQCAVMFVDIDGFKSVNDSHGHATGDLVLREVADRIRGRVRPGDFVARLGGDEFLLVLRGFEDMTGVVSFGYRLIREIEQPFRYGEHMFAVSASVGLTLPRTGLAGDDRDPAGRRCGVPRQAPRTWASAALRPRPAGLDRTASRARTGAARRDPQRRAGAPLPADLRSCSRASAGAPRRWCAGTGRASARSRRASSSPSPNGAR